MIETLKSLGFVVITVMIALVLQARGGSLSPEALEAADTAPVEQLRVFN